MFIILFFLKSIKITHKHKTKRNANVHLQLIKSKSLLKRSRRKNTHWQTNINHTNVLAKATPHKWQSKSLDTNPPTAVTARYSPVTLTSSSLVIRHPYALCLPLIIILHLHLAVFLDGIYDVIWPSTHVYCQYQTWKLSKSGTGNIASSY